MSATKSTVSVTSNAAVFASKVNARSKAAC
jgi:hypothetical protein